MSTSKHRKVGDWRNLMDKIHASLSNGTTVKLFEDDYFVFELIKLLYEDTLDAHIKLDILTVIEQYGSGVLPSNSVDQAITALLDVFKDLDTSPTSVAIATQLLLTVTTIFIENEELMDMELCTTFLHLLMELGAKINNVTTRRLRACCCQCLGQMESWKPGILWKWKETLSKLVKEEKTDVCQDYMQLLITIISNAAHHGNGEHGHAASQGQAKPAQSALTSVEGKDLLPTVSLVMDNVFLLTPAGLTNVACSVLKLVKTQKTIPPNIFKPLMLQCLPSLNSCIIHLMLHIQNQFRGEILSQAEEMLLLKRATESLNFPSLNSYTRLLIAEWLVSYLLQEDQQSCLSELKNMVPIVFDPLEVHSRKLALLALGSNPQIQKDLSRNLHYLTQLAETTGGVRVSCCLYHILYLHVATTTSAAVQDNVLRITRKLFQNFPHLIPLIVDFLRAVKTCLPQSKLHSEILNLLHETVLSLPINSLLSNYHNYLHVWVLSAQDSSTLQQKPLRRMLEIVREAVISALDDWDLGCLILSICRIMMLHHHTDILYTQMGDLLCFLMNEYGDSDIRDQARFFYALLTLNSDSKAKEILGAALIEGIRLGENIADFFPGSVVHTAPAEMHYLDISPVVWKREQLEIEYEKVTERLDCSFTLPVTDGLEEYWDQVLCLKTSMKCSLVTSLGAESDYNSLVAVSYLMSENKKIQLSDDVYLPYLSKKAPATVCFTVLPKVPEPVTINARVVFGHNKDTYESELSPLCFEFSDFLLPFPWDMFDIPDKQKFFNSHWINYTEKSQGRSSGVESVKILKCSHQALLEVWENAVIKSDDSQDEVDDYLFFLPPRFHLLFHVQARSTDLVVHIASDYWPILGYLDEYLDNLVDKLT